MSVKSICLNGNFYSAEDAVFNGANRAFSYGDALFETIHCLGTSAQFFENHYARLTQGMKVLKMQSGQNLSKDILLKYIEKLLNKNRIFKGARIRITVFRGEGGLYSPETNEVSWLMESTALEHEMYELNKEGLHIDIFDGVHKPVNILSNLKSTNSLLYVLAGVYRKENNLDECFILNQYGRIAESINSNLFLFSGRKLVTPPLSEGCIAGTMRHTLIHLAQKNGYELEECVIIEKHLLEAEEAFLTNAIQGIKWIGAYKDRRYFNFISRKLIVSLNKYAFQH